MTLKQIRSEIDKKAHWKKGIAWWALRLNQPASKIEEALGVRQRANRSDFDDYDSKEQYDNENVNRVNKSGNTAHQDQTLEEYCESVGLDPDKINRYDDVKYWTDAAGNRRYSVVPKTQAQESTIRGIIEELIEYIPREIPTQISPLTNPCAGVINLYDLHLDKISQIGQGLTMEDNINNVLVLFGKILAKVALFKPEVIYLPVGNDLFDTNDFRNTTKKGTPQELSVHWKESFVIGTNLIKDLIRQLLMVTDKVIVIPVEGNHDEDKIFYLNEVLKATYENVENVEVEEASAPRFHYKYGANMFSFGHGYHEKRKLKLLPGVVATEAPKIWGETKFREMFLGDVHHEDEYIFNKTKDLEGLRVRFMRQIGIMHSTWDRNNAYHLQPKTVSCEIFDYDSGKSADLITNV